MEKTIVKIKLLCYSLIELPISEEKKTSLSDQIIKLI